MPSKDATIRLGNTLEETQKQAIVKFFQLLTNQNNLELTQIIFDSLIEIALSRDEDAEPLIKTLSLMQNKSAALDFLRQTNAVTANNPISEELNLDLYYLFNSAKYFTKHVFDALSNHEEKTTTKPPKETYQLMLPAAHELVNQLSKPTESYEKKLKTQQTESARFIEENTRQTEEDTASQTSSQQRLVNLFKKALTENEPYVRTLHNSQVSIIKASLGEEKFNFFIKRYNLTENNFTLDHLRMLIVGVLPHSNQEWLQNDFVKNLFICCNLEHEWETKNPAAMQVLREHINLKSDAWKKMENIPHEGIINNGLNYLKTCFAKKWKFIAPIKFKSNSAFRRDLDTSLSIAKIGDWQNKPKETQKFAANEFLFHKLSCANLEDGSFIPVLESDGTRHFYKVKNLINETGIHGFALTPANPAESLDIKIVFKSSTNLAKEIIDTENYIPHLEFNRHKHTLLRELNSVVADFKKTISKEQQQKISINVGGHGTGGALAQHLIHELITDKASVECQKQPSLFGKTLNDNIQRQYEHEVDSDRKIKTEEYHDPVKKYSTKHLTQTKEATDEIIAPNNNHLRAINNFQLATVNSGGIPEKIRSNFIQALYILKEQTPQISIKCNKIMAGGDPVQQTGATDLAAYIPSELMPTTMIKFDMNLEGTYKKNLKQIAKSSALLVIQSILIAKSVVIPILAPLIALVNPKKETKNIIENASLLINNARHAHRDCHLNQKQNQQQYKIMSNAVLDNTNHQLNKELTTKIPVFTNKYYKKFKKSIYEVCKVMHDQSLSLQEKTTPIVATIDNSMQNHHVQQARQAFEDLKEFIDDPKGKTHLLIPALTTAAAKTQIQKQTSTADKKTSSTKPEKPETLD